MKTRKGIILAGDLVLVFILSLWLSVNSCYRFMINR